jgi:hypothetical protein
LEVVMTGAGLVHHFVEPVFVLFDFA